MFAADLGRSPSATDLRVLVVADDHLARAGLAGLLSEQPGCVIVGQVGGDAVLSADLEVYLPDVVLWDMGWDAAALERLDDLPDAVPPVLALLPDESHAAQAWAAGARGLLLRDADVPRLVAGLIAVARGVAVLDQELATAVISAGDWVLIQPAVALTVRELQVLRLLGEGLPNKSIADRLDISDHTVKFHVNAILGKLGAQSRTEAVMQATRLGLIPL